MPDNLSWLWAFIDWDSKIEYEKIPTQDYYQPLKLSIFVEEKKTIEKAYADAPLTQSAYRGQAISINDICAFIRYVSSLGQNDFSKSLFLMYFPSKFYKLLFF